MADKEKKPNYVLWIAIGVCLLIFLLGVTFYLLWRKISSNDVKSATISKTVDDMKVKTTNHDNEIRNRDEKIQKLTEELADMKTKYTQLEYQVKEIKKFFKGTKIVKGNGKKVCTDEGCTESVEDLE